MSHDDRSRLLSIAEGGSKGANGGLVTPSPVANALHNAAKSYERTGDARSLRLALLDMLRRLDGK